MKADDTSKNSEAAFNLMELSVVLGCVAVMALLVLPAMAASKVQSASAGCLYNLRHLMTGWEMYRTEYNDSLMPNAPLGVGSGKGWISTTSAENWGLANANTNPVDYTGALMWPYVNNNLSAYHCPGDVVPSANGTRIRSYSMNGQVGVTSVALIGNNVGWLVYNKGSDVIRPSPANLFIFADESPDSINDGYLEIDSNNSEFPDVPADYLEGGCGFSFADGHGEIHRWLTSALRIPVTPNYTANNIAVPANNPDWLWFTQHAASH